MVMGNLGCMTHGSTMIYPNDAFDPLLTLRTVAEEKATALYGVPTMRSEERRVGKECVSTCRYRWSPYHSKKKNHHLRHVVIVTKKKNIRNIGIATYITSN